MADTKDVQLIDELTKATHEGKIRWIATAKPQEFTASFGGKFSIIVAEGSAYALGQSAEHTSQGPFTIPPLPLPSPMPLYELRVLDQAGMVLHRVDDPSIRQLLDLARRSAFHADQAIDEILEELKSR